MNEIDKIQQLVKSLALNSVQAKKLNMAAGNAMRRVIRGNLKAQKDIEGKAFAPRKKPNFIQAKNGKISRNAKMFRAASRLLNQDANAEGVEVGYSRKAAHVLKAHNFGMNINFKHNLSGVRVDYVMPKREFLGISPDLISQVEQAIIDKYTQMIGA